MILILIPTKYEAELLIKKLRAPLRRHIGKLVAWSGELAGQPLAIGLVRMGLPLAAEASETFIAHFKPGRVILAGFAGGLNPRLKRGDVVRATLSNWAEAIHTTSDVVATLEDKRGLYESTHCDIVEMEASGVVAIAQKAQIPLDIVRVVSDAANECVPCDVLRHGYNARTGRETPLKMALYLATHPGSIGKLKSFVRTISPCRAALADAVEKAIYLDQSSVL